MELKGKEVTVVGLGRSGEAVASFLLSRGARVFITEIREKEEFPSLPPWLDEVESEFGGHTSRAIEEKDLIVMSPGVDPSHPLWVRAQNQGIPVVGELEFASWWVKEPVIAVTGTNGKTTTVSLIGHILSSAGRKVFVGGNIGSPLTRYLMEEERADYLILEVSSFQLEMASNFHPWAAVLLNIAPDHLDRHPDLSYYLEAKLRIFARQTPEDWAVLNFDDPLIRSASERIRAKVLPFGVKERWPRGAFIEGDEVILPHGGRVTLRGWKLPGRHNRENLLAALTVASLCGVDGEEMASSITSFRGLPHRLELVATIRGVSFWNDSKATNVAAASEAILSFDRPILLILGGRNKGMDFRTLREAISRRVKAVVALGEAKDEIVQALDGSVPIKEVEDLEEGVRRAWEMAEEGDVVLLSPACSSFDMFRDYAHRGEVFREAVKALKGEVEDAA